MPLRIVHNGRRRLQDDPQQQARLREVRDEVRARYAAESSTPGLLRRLVIELRIMVECRRACAELQPSGRALFFR